jgi:hypothetical protein
MKPKAYFIRNAILCDFVRQEITNKYIIIGTYTDQIMVAEFPALPMFSLYLEMYIEKTGTHKIYFRIMIDKNISAKGLLELEQNREGFAVLIIPPINIAVNSESVLRYQFSIDDITWSDILDREIVRGPLPAGVVAPIFSPPPS